MFPKTGNQVPRAPQYAYAHAIAEALRLELGDSHRAAKTVMRWTGASERSAKNWLNGARGPCGWHLVLLARESQLVTRTFLDLADRRSLAVGFELYSARDALAAAVIHIDEALRIEAIS